MMKKRFLVALGALSGALVACGSNLGTSPQGSGDDDGNGNGNGPGAGTGAAPASGGNGAGAASSGGSGATGPAATGGTGAASTGATGGSGGTSGSGGEPTCVPGIPATTQIPRLLNRQYDAAVRDLLGVTALDDGQPPSAGLQADFTGPMNAQAWGLYQGVAESIAKAVLSGPNRSKFLSCDPAAAGCLEDTIRTFGRKAFRRPLTDDEVARFMKLGQTTPAGTPEEVAEATLAAFLESPSFLLIPELTQETEGNAIKLSSYEVAARLSFLLWGSVPDDELNAAADADMLQTKEQIMAQAQRMIMDKARTGPMIADFHRVRWALDNGTPISHWWKISHDDNPLYSNDLKALYRQEIDDFFQDVVFSGGTFKDLFLSTAAFVNKDTAAIYGLDPAAYGTDLTRVELDPDQRPGFLTRIGFLSSYAHATSTSPILRGAFITVNMIGLDPGPPAPNAQQVTVTGDFATERDYVVALTSSQSTCKGCHIPYINPPGFVLEHYDSIGKWQDTDPRGGPIDATADVSFQFGADPVPITSTRQMMEQIAATPMAKEIYAKAWVSYAYGRDPNDNDQCLVDDLDTRLAQDGYTIANLLTDLTQADSFRLRVRETP